MNSRFIVLSLTISLTLAIAVGLRAEAAEVKLVKISAYDTMKYSVNKIEVQPGQKVVVELTNEGNLPKDAMGHNWVLLKAGVDPTSYANQAVTAKAENYEPKSLSNKVLASIPLLGPKEHGKVSFTAPSTPGIYHYLCSFPAHCAVGMKGDLVVK